MNLNTYYDGVANNGVMTNVRQEKIRMEGKVKWNVPSISDFTKTTVTIALQKYNETNHQWETLLDDGSNTYTKTLSGFRVTSPTKSHVFPDVEKYDESGNEIKYRVIQTNVDYTGVSPTVQIPISSYNPKDPLNPSEPYFTAPFTMNEKNYSAVAAPTPDTDNSYTIENRLAGDMQLKLTKFWKDSNGQGFGITDCASYPNITINVYQHGTNSNYLVPYMTITTNGTKGAFGNHGVDVDSYDPEPTEKTVPFNIKYRDRPDDDPETGVIQVTTGNTGDRASKWEFKIEVSDGVYKDISLPAFNENGNAYSYTVEESPVANAHTTYSYERVGNDLSANINNTYAIGGGGITVTFQKEWIDGTDISHEKPVKIAIVRIKKNGSFYYTDDEQIDLTDNFGKTHIVELKDSSNWYGQCGIDTTKTQEINGETKNCFDYIDLGEGKKRFLYTAIELNMSQNSADDYSRVVNYDGNSSVKESREAKLEADIANPTDPSKRCTEFNGTIDAYLDSVYGESHLPGYDVEVKAGSTTDSVVGARKYVVVNKRKGQVNVVFNKTWQDGSNSEETRNGKYRVYLYQNGKRVVSKADPAGPLAPEDSITSAEGDVTTLDVTSPQQVEYTKDSHPDTQEFSFVGLPQYDEDGNIYHYSVREFLVKDDRELEIALTDTKDSTKTGYVITDNSEETSFSVPETDSSMLVRNDTFNYTNTITGEKTGGASFYVLWHDQTSYDNGHRPDVNYVLYYKAKGESDDKLQVYNGEYKVEWHPMYDDEAKTVASRYYQYATFTKLPLANDQGIPYEYYAVPSLNNPGEHYKEAYYKSNAHVVAATKDESPITTGAGRKHYDMGAGSEADKLPDGSKMLPENGIVEYIIDEYINVKGNKLWKLSDSGDIDVNKYPDAEIYLWRFNDHDEDNKENPDFTNAFFKATWTSAEQEMGYYYIAAIDCKRGDYKLALEHIERSIVKNYHNVKARALKGLILSMLSYDNKASVWFEENLELDAFDYISLIESKGNDTAKELMGERISSYIECAIDYSEAGFYKKAVDVLNSAPKKNPMVYYYLALNAGKYDVSLEKEALSNGANADSLYCLPNKLEDICALNNAIQKNELDGMALYYLGCLLYDKRQYDEAVDCFERSSKLNPEFPTVWRNLSLAYFNKRGEKELAKECMEKAYALDENDARVLLELHQLYGKLGYSIEERFNFLEAHRDVAFMRDDLYIEYCTLLNALGRYEEAYELIMAHKFHPWEGGEGKVTSQYALALKQMALKEMDENNYDEAKSMLLKSLVFPHNLGEGKLEGAKDNDIYYYLGLCERNLGNEEKAIEYLTRASLGEEEPASAMYYNDQPADMILYQGLASLALGNRQRASSKFYKLISYGEKHYYDKVKIDYFAVSLPDLQLFDEDLNEKNRKHCEYLIELGNRGLKSM